MRIIFTVLTLVVLILPSSRLSAEKNTGKILDAESADLLATDLFAESADGASNYATCISNGRLSAGISPWGELTFLRWPNLTYNDQLRYFTEHANPVTAYLWGKTAPVRMGAEAPGPDWRLYGKPIVKHPELGSRGGILIEKQGFVWLGDPTWTSSRRFDSDYSTIFITRLERDGISVEIEDGIMPETDMMIRRFTIEPGASRFIYQATFAPAVETPDYFRRSDNPKAGFAAAYCHADDLIIHFCPEKKNARRLESINPNDITPADLDGLFPEGGAFIAWGFMEKSSGFQVGRDATIKGGKRDARIAGFIDAADGRLSGNSLQKGMVDAALGVEISPEKGASVTLLIAAADSADKAADMIRKGRLQTTDSLFKAVNAAWEPLARKIYIPTETDPVAARVARRSVLNLLQGQDAQSGAIVASLSRQPSYHYDWPRDGAFFDLALDMAGFTENVTRHIDFYAASQRRESLAFNPIMAATGMNPFESTRGHFWANIGADGKTKSIIDIPLPFEIDETGLVLWDIWRHEMYLAESDRAGYRERTMETLELAADAAAGFVDVKKKWVRKAYEDDNLSARATYHGASSILTGLCAAVDAGRRWGVDREKVDYWAEAADALRQGMMDRIDDPEALEKSGWRGLQWTLWPSPLFQQGRDERAKVLTARLAGQIQAKISPESPGFAYLGEQIFILALAAKEFPEYDAILQNALRVFTHEAPFRGSDCYGEVVLWGDFAGTGTRVTQNRTSIPHLWNGITSYLAVMAIYEPDKFNQLVPPLP